MCDLISTLSMYPSATVTIICVCVVNCWKIRSHHKQCQTELYCLNTLKHNGNMVYNVSTFCISPQQYVGDQRGQSIHCKGSKHILTEISVSQILSYITDIKCHITDIKCYITGVSLCRAQV